MSLQTPFLTDVTPLFTLAGGIETLVESATGWPGMGIIFVYSFLIAFILPGPSEVVLVAPIDLGFSPVTQLASIMLVSATGKAAGSVFAFHIGQEVKQSGPIVRWLRNSRWNILAWSEKQSVTLARQYGYAGLAMALSVPFFPDTISIYAFSILEKDYLKFAIATFIGSLGRLLVTVGIFGGVSAII
ncbi:membrane protein YqaA with SNARE-associated domain [Halohasta litchfieldiae]|jgi:membrane protein YqaA with SNARE-associated domain|uniref:Membrane protein YqaA, SNARE-associated domain n=1 Tax=Halohasta litchfieldiae TaxID=1073996 RepID=A0A1H6U6L7_9EURY|nr:VTT domain-containing protein [Halohasta litchfieldiae]ATW89064.1 membrane protein YqaA with SNARE-associated domain [Halohasta litchfieldiae]SEI87989.1 membrane protein YqaA, SNARE-associated domain [Halohasta litchfieldiae]